uniref:Uncharacterized protein n=1 Tax=Ascaris lumbricoides TaxID=6252 RepID=A0A9J2NZA2_ASCLU
MTARFEKSRHEEEPFDDAATYVKRDKSKRSSSADYLTHLLNRLLNAVRTRNLTANDENGEEVESHIYSFRIIAKKDLICDLEKCVQEKVEIMKTTAQLRMEAALRAKFQQQRYAFILSVVHGLETAYKKALASASVDIANRISIRDDARTRIERLRDQLEDLTISAERLAQEWILDENHLQFTLNCLRQTKDALLLSTRRVTTNDDAEKKELNVLRRQRATLLIKTCKGNATLLSLRQINKRKPKMKFDLDTRLIQRRNPLS